MADGTDKIVADGSDDDGIANDMFDRRACVQQLVNSIGLERKKKQKQKPMNPIEMPNKRRRGCGRYPELKIQIGWLHFHNRKFRQVTARKGGGTRTYQYSRDVEQTVEMLTEYGKKVFFPSGKNEWGQLSEMDVHLSTYSGDVIEKFVDHDGKKCSLQEYLKGVGIYSSQFYVYLKTQQKGDDESGEKEKLHSEDADNIVKSDVSHNVLACVDKFKVNNRLPGEIHVRYTKETESRYTESRSSLNCYSVEECYSFSSPDTEREGYNPLEDNYKVTAVRVNQNTFLDPIDLNNNDAQFEYPLAHPDANVILHTPDQIVGVETSSQNQLLLGVITKEHNSGAYFSWYRDDEQYASGIDLCFIIVTLPGQYKVHVVVGDTAYICEPVSVTSCISNQTIQGQAQVSGVVTTPMSSVQPEACGKVTTPVSIVPPEACEMVAIPMSSVPQEACGKVTTPMSSVPPEACGMVTISMSSVPPEACGKVTTPMSSVPPEVYGMVTIPISSVPPDACGMVTIPMSSVPPKACGMVTTPMSSVPPDACGMVTIPISSVWPEVYGMVTTPMTSVPSEACGMVTTPMSSVPPEAFGMITSPMSSVPPEACGMVTTPMSSVPPEACGMVTAPMSSFTPQDIEVVTTPMSSVSPNDNEIATTTISSVSPLNIEVVTTAMSSVSPNNNEIATTTMSSVSPLNFEVVTSPMCGGVPDVITAVTAPMSCALPQDSLMVTCPMSDILQQNNVANTSSMTGISPLESVITNHPMTGILPQVSLPVNNPMQSGELTTSLVKIRSAELIFGEEINRGAFGVVFRADWNGTDVAVKQVAIKRLKKMKKMLARELEVSAILRHPNIVLLMGYSVEGNQLNLITEYLNGPNLDQLLFDEGEFVFPREKKVNTAYQVCAAVAYLHSRRPLVLHRDIKPENILLTKCLDTAKLCDMGLSKFKSMRTLITTVASGNLSQPGTPAYQAPEVLLLGMSASVETEIWSLCATLVELFSEETVWDTQNMSDESDDENCERAICNSMKNRKEPDGLTAFVALDFPAKVKQLISCGLEYEPKSRPAALQLCKDFREMCCSFSQ